MMDKARFRWLHPYFGGKPLEAITRTLIDKVTEAKLAEGVSNSTANRLLEVIRAILRKCVNDWEWLDKAPHVRMLKEPARRIRFLTHAEAEIPWNEIAFSTVRHALQCFFADLAQLKRGGSFGFHSHDILEPHYDADKSDST